MKRSTRAVQKACEFVKDADNSSNRSKIVLTQQGGGSMKLDGLRFAAGRTDHLRILPAILISKKFIYSFNHNLQCL